MNRLQKKCLLASAAFHGLLVGVFLFGSAFFTPKAKTVQLPVIQVINGEVVDQLLYGGGNPNVRPHPVPAAPAPKPAPEAVKPQPKPAPEPKVEKKPEPPQPKVAEPKETVRPRETSKPKEPDPGPDPEPAKPKSKPLPHVSTRIVRRSTVDHAAERAAQQAREHAAAEASAYSRRMTAASAAMRNAVSGLDRSLSSTTISTEGVFGPGGPAMINYGQLIKSIYDGAWLVSDDISDDDSTVKARIVIQRNGSVLSARIISASPNRALNASVQKVLDDVKFTHPFPAGAKEEERTFIINFNLKAKRQIG